jgi:hypothetical protein
MKNLSVYLPTAKFVVALLVVLAGITAVRKYGSNNAYVLKGLSYIGWA